ncbi:MAG: non-canonical purine NTP pyrophosphatase, partial [Gammaproteobacteria bacterium]
MNVVLASHNAGKLAELSALLGPLGWRLTDPGALGIPAPDEVRATFVENALDKARHVAAGSGLPALADDSGLVVPALGGAPGIHSVRYAGAGATDADNNAQLLRAIATLEAPAAYYYCALVFVRRPDDPAPVIGVGTWHGTLQQTRSGSGGFGYDPLFRITELGMTAAELPAARKNRISHRA